MNFPLHLQWMNCDVSRLYLYYRWRIKTYCWLGQALSILMSFWRYVNLLNIRKMETSPEQIRRAPDLGSSGQVYRYWLSKVIWYTLGSFKNSTIVMPGGEAAWGLGYPEVSPVVLFFSPLILWAFNDELYVDYCNSLFIFGL